MKINCISCGHGFGIDDSYADYEGLLRCATCAYLLDVKIEDGMIRGVKPGSLEAPPAVIPAQRTAAPAPIAAPIAAPTAAPVAAPTPIIQFPVAGSIDTAPTIDAQPALNIVYDTPPPTAQSAAQSGAQSAAQNATQNSADEQAA